MNKKNKKLKIGVYGLTGCAGCQLSILFNEDELLDLISMVELRAFPFIKEHNIEEKFDLVLCEGLVASNNDLITLKKIRKKTKVLVALGACAHTGCIPAYRHWTLKENYKHLIYDKAEDIKDLDPNPLDAHVKVDFVIPGCPPNKSEIMEFFKDIILGKTPRQYNNPVCVECKKNNNSCLLIQGKPCMGPITAGGCNSVCINSNYECWGCRGPSNEANYKAWIHEMKSKGFRDSFIKARMKMFAGLKINETAFDNLK